ncbi:uncharacterized protein LAESUDRAFT_638864 [Laetiporus sulphureus 93-53]|uniref:Mediator of RNA polymerase II transcription subunit 17 n=1 Tax=Laetiporus sulphureus 93-53 TaxID=1314785 RepID=A0A165I1A9_9APHY|nr:uncharacterized protein LAESUDRAFT_638864 [Laetiporus sulphureus 93-53]KZT12461.1 hypothetical protein LAESUDRAFT_638864 [Laetiporus sulphureus 93-53]
MEEPRWKKIKLSLERPYKDDDGEPIPVLLDITPDGKHVYEPKEDSTAKVGENLRKIFLERGLDFFDKKPQDREKIQSDHNAEPEQEGEQEDKHGLQHPMTPEELFKMRMEVMPQLHIALGEMSQARDLLSLLLASTMPLQTTSQPQLQTPPSSQLPPSALTATVVTKPPSILSVQAFNSQLVGGGKDRSLRRAADLFKSAAENMESGRMRSDRYWVDALKIRRGNWGLIPAPLPLGSATGQGADKTSKDFLVSFGLEESPSILRRRAIGRIPTLDSDQTELEFPLRQYTRLQVAISAVDADGFRRMAHNTVPQFDESTLEGSLRAAQAEIVEQEIFSVLIREASSLQTASAQVSERLIVIEAAQGIELRFELVDDHQAQKGSSSSSESAKCDLIYASLHVLLLRAHAVLKAERLKRTGVSRVPGVQHPFQPPPILQPVIDMLQYQVFCDHIYAEIDRKVRALQHAGVPTRQHFEAVGGSGEEFLKHFSENKPRPIGGEALIRIDDWQVVHTLRFTFVSPSILVAHLPQATLGIASIPQLSQLLADEVGGCILKRICDIGTERCAGVDGTWFVDLLTGRSVGRWEGCVL